MTQFWVYWLGLLIATLLLIVIMYIASLTVSLGYKGKLINFLANNIWMLWLIALILIAIGMFFMVKILASIPYSTYTNITGGGK